MTSRTLTLEFLTPCFCAGANQSHAELRPSAIRGQLRWWFRALGGSPGEESAVFGSVQAPHAVASSLQVRALVVSGTGEIGWWNGIQRTGEGPTAYLLGFFCGAGRIQKNGALAPNSRAKVFLKCRSFADRTLNDKLETAINCFFSVGAVGFRITRAAGAFATIEKPLTQTSFQQMTRFLSEKGFQTELYPRPFATWVELVKHSEDQLEQRFRSGMGISAGRNGTTPNILGSARPRQASVLHFRPIRLDNQLRLLLIEAPHRRTLGNEALRSQSYRPRILS